MKVAFDQHVPISIAKTFIAIAKERAIQRISKGLIWEKAEDYAPKTTDRDYVRKSDVPWLDRFAAAGGHAVISGDVSMRAKSHEMLALYQHGFVTIFFETPWGNWASTKKSALMLHWWEEISTKIKAADRGTFWIVPCSYPQKDGQLRNVSLGLAQFLRDAPHRGIKPVMPERPVVERPPKPQDDRQFELLDKLNEKQK